MTTVEGTHRHASAGRTCRFRATYEALGPTRLRWRVEWWPDDGSARREADGVIDDAHLLAAPQRAVIDRVIDAIDAG